MYKVLVQSFIHCLLQPCCFDLKDKVLDLKTLFIKGMGSGELSGINTIFVVWTGGGCVLKWFLQWMPAVIKSKLQCFCPSSFYHLRKMPSYDSGELLQIQKDELDFNIYASETKLNLSVVHWILAFNKTAEYFSYMWLAVHMFPCSPNKEICKFCGY